MITGTLMSSANWISRPKLFNEGECRVCILYQFQHQPILVKVVVVLMQISNVMKLRFIFIKSWEDKEGEKIKFPYEIQRKKQRVKKSFFA
jgi:hypothetical protein